MTKEWRKKWTLVTNWFARGTHVTEAETRVTVVLCVCVCVTLLLTVLTLALSRVCHRKTYICTPPVLVLAQTGRLKKKRRKRKTGCSVSLWLCVLCSSTCGSSHPRVRHHCFYRICCHTCETIFRRIMWIWSSSTKKMAFNRCTAWGCRQGYYLIHSYFLCL